MSHNCLSDKRHSMMSKDQSKILLVISFEFSLNVSEFSYKPFKQSISIEAFSRVSFNRKCHI